MECTPVNVCRNCAPPSFIQSGVISGPQCFAVPHYTAYGVGDYGNVSGEAAMMKEIYARGPMVCQLATDQPFLLNYSLIASANEGVYKTDQKFKASDIDHDVEVVGWGETASGLKYWAVR